MPPNPTELTELLTPEETAQFLRVSLSHIRKLTCRRLIPFSKIGKSVRYPRKKIENWLATNTTEARRPLNWRREARGVSSA